MNAFGTPAAAGPQQQGPSFAADWRDWVRLAGGVLFASGGFALFTRKQAEWGKWPLVLVLVVPCALLYALALRGRDRSRGLEGWQSAYVTFGALLLPAALGQLALALGAEESSRLVIAAVFAVAGAVAIVASQLLDAWWQMLIGAVYLIFAWVAFWIEVLDEPSAGAIRALLLIFAALLLAGGLVLGRRERAGASDLITVAGLSAIAAGAISIPGVDVAINGALGADTPKPSEPSQVWNFYLLAVSLVLIGYGAKSRTRGPGYVGGLGLFVFIILVGRNVVAITKGKDIEDITAVVGWPLALLVLGAIAIVVGFVMGGDDDRGVGAQGTFGHPDPGVGGADVRTQFGGAPTAPGAIPPPGGPPAPPVDQPTQQRPLPPQPPPG